MSLHSKFKFFRVRVQYHDPKIGNILFFIPINMINNPQAPKLKKESFLDKQLLKLVKLYDCIPKYFIQKMGVICVMGEVRISLLSSK